jgi:hypothetical protein
MAHFRALSHFLCHSYSHCPFVLYIRPRWATCPLPWLAAALVPFCSLPSYVIRGRRLSGSLPQASVASLYSYRSAPLGLMFSFHPCAYCILPLLFSPLSEIRRHPCAIPFPTQLHWAVGCRVRFHECLSRSQPRWASSLCYTATLQPRWVLFPYTVTLPPNVRPRWVTAILRKCRC